MPPFLRYRRSAGRKKPTPLTGGPLIGQRSQSPARFGIEPAVTIYSPFTRIRKTRAAHFYSPFTRIRKTCAAHSTIPSPEFAKPVLRTSAVPSPEFAKNVLLTLQSLHLNSQKKYCAL